MSQIGVEPTVTLLSATQDPVVTIFQCWETSRHNDYVPDVEDIRDKMSKDAIFRQKVERTFEQVLEAGIPVAENVSFTFLIEGMSIALREQMVRHRVGHHFGERIGCDIVPDLADSTWWAQSMRILDMGQFATEGRFHLPDSMVDWPKDADPSCSVCRGSGELLETQANGAVFPRSCDCWTRVYKGKTVYDNGKYVTVAEFWRRQMMWIQSAYRKLVEVGIPMEDARGLVPLAATHRMTWTINLAALKHVVGKRGCWILQLGIWRPIIEGMIEALAEKFGEVFRTLISPPCLSGSKFKGCQFKLDNERRIQGEDEIPPCSLYLHHHADEARTVPLTVNGNAWTPQFSQKEGETFGPNTEKLGHVEAVRRLDRYNLMRRSYAQLWGRDADTGAFTDSTSPAAPGLAPTAAQG